MTNGENLEPESSTATTSEAAEGEATPKTKLVLDVDISDVGPCKKHLKVVIPRSEVDRQFGESFGTMKREAHVPGFRPGHAPKQLVEKRFRKEVSEQVKSLLVMSALEQIDEDYKLTPITQPELDINAIELPADGPLSFEMDVEVRPEFKLPEYKSLSVKRPIREVSETDVDAQLKAFLERYAQLVPKTEGAAELGDFVTAELTFYRGDKTYNVVKEVQFRFQPELRFQDGHVADLASVLAGAKPGDVRETDAVIGSSSPDPELRGQTIRVKFEVQDLKTLRLPTVNQDFLRALGFDTQDELRDALRDVLKRRYESLQRQAIRRDVVDQLIAATPFELPADLVARQEKSQLRRLVAQLQQEGASESDIRARQAELRANAHEMTLRSLKEFFLLAKIAEVEDIKVEDQDVEDEIEAIALRTDESPRRVRARLEKEGLADMLASDLLERKAIDRILQSVTFVDVALEDQKAVETLDEAAVSAPEGADEAEASAEAAGDESSAS